MMSGEVAVSRYRLCWVDRGGCSDPRPPYPEGTSLEGAFAEASMAYLPKARYREVQEVRWLSSGRVRYWDPVRRWRPTGLCGAWVEHTERSGMDSVADNLERRASALREDLQVVDRVLGFLGVLGLPPAVRDLNKPTFGDDLKWHWIRSGLMDSRLDVTLEVRGGVVKWRVFCSSYHWRSTHEHDEVYGEFRPKGTQVLPEYVIPFLLAASNCGPIPEACGNL